MRVTTLGAVFLPQLPPERLRDVALAADRAGLAELWLWEDCFRASGIASAAAALAWTSHLRIGLGLLPVPLRNVALTAMEAATLSRAFPHRLLLGVGHGVQDWMGQVGARVASPLTLLREHLAALRVLLAGREVTVSGRYVHLDRVRLDWPPAAPPPLLAGAVGPRSLTLSGEHADGTILTGGTTPDAVRQARRLIDEGRSRRPVDEGRDRPPADESPARPPTGAGRAADDRRVAGARSGDHHVVVFLHAATGPDAARRLEAERLRWGYDSMDERGVAGDAATVAAAVRRWARAGADTVVLQPTADDPDPAGFVRFIAREVRPRLP